MTKEKLLNTFNILRTLIGPIFLALIIIVGLGAWVAITYSVFQEERVTQKNRVMFVCNGNGVGDCSEVVDFDEDWFRNCYNAKLKNGAFPYRYCGQYYVVDAQDNDESTEKTKSDEQSMDADYKLLEETILHSYDKDHMRGLESYDDPNLVTYYIEHLNKQCPFYKPNGVQYRECVLAIIEDLERRSTMSRFEHAELGIGCAAGAENTAEYTTLGYVDLYNTCMAYKLFTSGLHSYSDEEMEVIMLLDRGLL